MAVYVENVESEVALVTGELSEQQLEKLVRLVAARLRRLEREERDWDDERTIDTRGAPPLAVQES